MKTYFFFIVFLVGWFHPLFAAEKETLGRMSVRAILLKPEIQIVEPFTANISLGDSLASLSWSYKEQFLSVFTLGPKKLLNPSLFYGPRDALTEDEVSLIEAYGSYDSGFGEILLGRLPIEYGLEGGRKELETDLHRTLFYQKGVLSLRDHGLGLRISHAGFLTRFYVHNGEGQNHTDGRVWVTGTWGFQSKWGQQFGFMGATGTTKPEATSASTVDYAGFDSSKESKWRMGGIFYGLDTPNIYFGIEAQVGKVIQDEDEKNNFITGHFEFNYHFNPYWGVVSRYDYWDPNDDVDKDNQTQISFGFRISDKYRSSSFYIIGIKNIEETNDIANDELKLVWRLTP